MQGLGSRVREVGVHRCSRGWAGVDAVGTLAVGGWATTGDGFALEDLLSSEVEAFDDGRVPTGCGKVDGFFECGAEFGVAFEDDVFEAAEVGFDGVELGTEVGVGFDFAVPLLDHGVAGFEADVGDVFHLGVVEGEELVGLSLCEVKFFEDGSGGGIIFNVFQSEEAIQI